MYLSKIKKISVALCFTLLPLPVLAAGLGQLNVKSGIGEPLKAEIELLSVSAAERSSLKARVAPKETYALQGLERPVSHNGIRILVTKSASGKNILKLNSNQPMTEPFLDMLVEVEWESGRVLREYTVLLDPPGYDGEVTASQVQSPTIKAVDKKVVKSAPIKSAGSIKNTAPTVASTTQTAPIDDYLTRKGDTLSKIARRMKPDGVSLDQMLVGLYEANPEAFVSNNMNRLKVGKILQPPTEEALNAISKKAAQKEIKVQAANWNEYRNKLAGIVATSAPEVSEVDDQTTSGKVKSSAEDKSIPESTGPKDVVKLSTADAKSAADMEAKITALEEEVSAREKGLIEAQERTAALEKQIEDMQKLLTLRNDALTEAQTQIAQEETAQKDSSQDPKDNAEAKQGEVTTEDGPEKVVEAAVQEAKQEPKVAAPAAVKPDAKPVTVDKQVKPVEQLSFIDSILANFSNMLSSLNTTMMAAGAALIALVAGSWFYLRNKRRKNLADFEQGIMTSGGLKANTVFGNTSGTSVDTGDTSFLTSFSQSTSGGMIDTNDVDPIAEAEVYMAYGRDAQAEEILKDAISKEPKRYELHLKLLEMYAASKNMSAFETVSGELYTTLGAEDPTWAKVAEIGIKLEPNNPLYQAKAGLGGASEAPQESDSAPSDNVDGELDASDFSDSPLAAEADLDFSLNSDAEPEETPQVAMVEDVAETLDGVQGEVVDEAVLDIPNADEVLETESSTLDFDLNASTDDQAALEVAAEEANFTSTMPDLDFPSLDTGDSPTEAESVEFAPIEGTVEESSDAATLSDATLDLAQEDSVPEVLEDANALEMPAAELPVEELVLDVNESAEDTITFDTTETASESAPEENILDVSDISLEMNDDVDNAIAEATPAVEEVSDTAEPESEEVETKLELVAAYIDMEDKEGAKELLDEVVKEGGTNQRKRAEELLATLG